MILQSQFLGVLEGSQARSREVNARLQAGDRLVLVGVDIGEHGVGSLSLCVSKTSSFSRLKKEPYRRNGSRQVDALGDGHLTLIKGAVKVDVVELLAQVCGRREQLNEAVLDDHLDVRALLDGFLDVAGRCDEKRVAAIECY